MMDRLTIILVYMQVYLRLSNLCARYSDYDFFNLFFVGGGVSKYQINDQTKRLMSNRKVDSLNGLVWTNDTF